MNIAVFYHGVMRAPGFDPGEQAALIFCEQMRALAQSGLADAAEEIYVGMNESDQLLAASLVPAKTSVFSTGDGSRGEYPTLDRLQRWLPGHDGWLVCYHHMKGVAHPGDAESNWRRCMEAWVIWNWQRCVQDLSSGAFDTVGAHWNTFVDQRYWAGTFWWATQAYLLTLPILCDKVDNNRSYEGEVWIGKTARPRVRYLEYAPGHRFMTCPP